MSKIMEKVAEKIASSLMKCSEDARHSIMAGIFCYTLCWWHCRRT